MRLSEDEAVMKPVLLVHMEMLPVLLVRAEEDEAVIYPLSLVRREIFSVLVRMLADVAVSILATVFHSLSRVMEEAIERESLGVPEVRTISVSPARLVSEVMSRPEMVVVS